MVTLMTSVDKLIRTLCRARQDALKAEQRRLQFRTVRQTVPLTELPKRVRTAFQQLGPLTRQAERLRKLVTDAGYESSLPRNGQVSRSYAVVSAERRAHEQLIEERLKRIEELKAEALVASLGKTPTQARDILQQLQRDLDSAVRGPAR